MINDSLSIGLVAGLVSILVGIPVFFVLAMLAERNSARRVADHAYHRLERYIDRRVRWAVPPRRGPRAPQRPRYGPL
jgi:hypothetical protein